MYMDLWESFSRNLLLMTSACFFMLPLAAMKGRKQKNALIFLGGVVVLCLSDWLFLAQSGPQIQMIVRISAVAGCFFFCYRSLSWEVIYASVWSTMIFYCVSILWMVFIRAADVHSRGTFAVWVCCYLFFGMFYLLFGLTIFRWMPRNGTYHAGPKRTLSAVFVLFLFQYSNYYYYQSKEESTLAVLVQVYCVTFLYLQAELFKKSEINRELGMLERLWYQQKKQYQIAKDQMQLIDRKCHDLKYQVEAMRHISNPAEREKNFNELEKSIRIYDSIVNTGNEILDTLLSEKSLICEARQIALHCVIDGAQLSYMNPVDLYALFGNAIDNAIECVEKLAGLEMRFIDVCLTKKQNFHYIRISNPVQKAPEYEGDLPKTTKKNRQYHGLGLKSIRHIARKYGGEISVTTEFHCFVLEILLPQKAATYAAKTAE